MNARSAGERFRRPFAHGLDLALGLLVRLACVCACVCVSVSAFAATSPDAHAGRIVLSLADGRPGPLFLTPGQGGYVGTVAVTNVGPEPLVVSRVSIRGDEDDVRSPSRLSVRFTEGAPTTATLAPGASKDLIVAWMPEKNPRVVQAFGHVIVTSTDEQAGEVAMGFRAQIPTGLGWLGAHVLTLLVLWPLAVVVVAAASGLAGRRQDPIVRRAALGVGVGELALAFVAYRAFAPDVVRGDGNDGFQLVERAVWVRSLGAEWYVGVDGASVMLVVLAAIVGVVAVVLATGERRSDAYYAALALLASGIAGVLVALDLALLFVAWETVWLAVVLLLGGWGGGAARGGEPGARAAAKTGIYAAIGSAALALAFAALSGRSDRSFLVDGSAVVHTLSIPELARTSFAAKAPLLGMPMAGVTWSLLFVAVAAATPIVPLHGWLADALEDGPGAASVLIGSVVVALGPYVLVRVGFGALPEGARWAASSLSVIGAMQAAWGALCAMAQRDLRRFTAYAIVSNAGLALYGAGSLTPQGLAGAVMAPVAHGLGAAVLLGVAAALEQRIGTADAVRTAGLLGETPLLATLLGVALGVSLGVPGLVGSWPVILVFVGGFVRHPAMGLLVAAALVACAAAHFRMGRLLLLEKTDPTWRRSSLLEPFTGRLPDATGPERLAFFPVIALAIVLGLWPAPVLGSVQEAAREAAAVADPTLEGK